MIPLAVPWWVAVLALIGGAVLMLGLGFGLVWLLLHDVDRGLADLPTSESREFTRAADEAIGIVEDGAP